jgi:hypothetical protein
MVICRLFENITTGRLSMDQTSKSIQQPLCNISSLLYISTTPEICRTYLAAIKTKHGRFAVAFMLLYITP